eukprot:gene1211-1408_t
MGKKLKNTGLVGLGVVAGIAVSLQFSAMAQRPADPALPLEELRQLADVFGLIKSDYVEAVEDKKLLTEAISGMVASLDPHSAYLDKKAYAELREGSQGKYVGLGVGLVHRAAHHQRHQLGFGDVAQRAFGDELAVAQHGVAVRHGEDL